MFTQLTTPLSTQLTSILCALVSVCLFGSASADEITLELTDDTQVNVDVLSAKGRELVLWVPSEHGFPSGIDPVVVALAKLGVESWRADMLGAYFLPAQESSLDEIPDKHMAQVIQQAGQRSGKNIVLVSSGRGAIVALQGARTWQQQHPGSLVLKGVILLHPNLYVDTPKPGSVADYVPIAQATNLPVYVIQPALSPWRWQLPELRRRLEFGGSTVYMHLLPGIRDRFFFRPDASVPEQQQHMQLAYYLNNAVSVLSFHSGPRKVAPISQQRSASKLKREVTLQEMEVIPAWPLALQQLHGNLVDLQQLRGQVVLVNFWAGWCPPCVHEMPSMQRLQNNFTNKRFLVLAVNMAESVAEIDAFIKHKVKIDFPILLDKDGAALRRWNVFAFPTSYLVDKYGRFRYSLFGAIDWDTPEIVEVVQKLVAE